MVTITAVSFEEVATRKPLRFPAPMIELAARDDAYEFQWHLIQYAFEINDPTTFPPLAEGEFSEDEVRILRRYVSKAEELARATMLTADDGVTMHWSAETPEPRFEQKTRTALDIEAGFAATFRQFYLHNEDASYAKVQRTLYEHAETATDAAAAARLDELKRWRIAVRTSHTQSVRKSMLLRAMELREYPPIPADELAVFPDRETPEALIDRYINVEHLHWDSERAKALESRPGDLRRQGGFERLDFVDGATGLAHLYIGHAELVRRAARLAEPCP